MSLNLVFRRELMKSLLLLGVTPLLVACGTPNLSQECSMNGFGNGSCTFTNTGSASGTVCGRVVVKRIAPAVGVDYVESKSTYGRDDAKRAMIHQIVTDVSESSVFCSGEVGSKETKSVDFGVANVIDLCAGDAAWSKNCSFAFVAEDPEKDSVEP